MSVLLAGFLGGFVGALVGFVLMGMVLVVNQLRLDRSRRAVQDKALADLSSELKTQVNSAISQVALSEFSSVPQPRAEA